MIRDNWWVAAKDENGYERSAAGSTLWVRLIDVRRVSVEQVGGGGNTWRVNLHVVLGDSVTQLLYTEGIFDRQVAERDASVLLTACVQAMSMTGAMAK